MIKLFRNLNPLNIFLLVILAMILKMGILVNLPEEVHVEYIEPFARLLEKGFPVSVKRTTPLTLSLPCVPWMTATAFGSEPAGVRAAEGRAAPASVRSGRHPGAAGVRRSQR